MMYKLKPLKQFKQYDGSVILSAPTHEYVVRDTVVNYINLHSNQTGIKYCQSYDECINWINNIHVPSKLAEYFELTGESND